MSYTYKEWPVVLEIGHYGNGRVAIVLIHAEDRDAVAAATVNLPDESAQADEVFIKNYSENEGMLDWLVANNIVTDTGRKIKS